MAVEWFCQIMGSEVGPLTQDQLVDMVRNHQINPEDLVRRNTSQWVPAFGVKGLFEAAAKPPAPKPEPAEEVAVEPSTPVAADKAVVGDTGSQAITTFEDNGLAADWYCIASGEKRGPLEFKDLQLLARAGKLRERDRVWRGSSPKWQKASEVDGLLVSR